MTDFPPQRDDERFQEVLGRLDALVRRGQPEDTPPPPPAISEATIPVLTDVYSPADEVLRETHAAGRREIEQIITDLLPEMMGMMESALLEQLKPALNASLNAAVAEIRPQIEDKIRQRLLQALAHEAD